MLHARKDKDYRIKAIDERAGATIIAIHGGGIEPLTGELATAIAGKEHNLYVLEGIRPADNEELRVPVARFQEMRLQALVRRSEVALSIEGISGRRHMVHLGGRNRRLKRLLEAHLAQAGLEIAGPATPGPAHDPTRFYNQAAAGGVQLELGIALRREMVTCPLAGYAWQDASHWTPLLYSFVDAVRAALGAYQTEVRADPAIALQRFEAATAAFPPTLRHPIRHDHHPNDDNGSEH